MKVIRALKTTFAVIAELAIFVRMTLWVFSICPSDLTELVLRTIWDVCICAAFILDIVDLAKYNHSALDIKSDNNENEDDGCDE